MLLNGLTRQTQHAVIACVLVIAAGPFIEAQAQRPNTQAQQLRDMVRAIERKEMDQILLRKPLPAPTDEPARKVVLKQIREDFRDIQSLNNKMMSNAWTLKALDYVAVSEMISQIRGKANRLKLNLNLPAPDPTKKVPRASPVNDKDFRASLLILDQTIMRFVKNPVFQEPKTIEVSQATKARLDLESVIELSAELKKAASKLGKGANR